MYLLNTAVGFYFSQFIWIKSVETVETLNKITLLWKTTVRKLLWKNTKISIAALYRCFFIDCSNKIASALVGATLQTPKFPLPPIIYPGIAPVWIVTTTLSYNNSDGLLSKSIEPKLQSGLKVVGRPLFI